MYKVKEMFYSLQGEGARAGRAAVFCRFSKCNLWNGREEDRLSSVCQFCDTDIVGTDGQNGGVFESAEALASAINALWPNEIDLDSQEKPYVIFTGGEPLLQLDETLTAAMHRRGFEVAIETNGTLTVPSGVDWVCLSPKADAKLAITQCDELKLVFPQPKAMPERFEQFNAQHYFLSPMATPNIRTGPDTSKANNTKLALTYCLSNPQWRLTLQLHKILDID
jgi:7-carboxy-7-deazaguanine synthase